MIPSIWVKIVELILRRVPFSGVTFGGHQVALLISCHTIKKKKERNGILILVPSLPSQKNENLSFPI